MSAKDSPEDGHIASREVQQFLLHAESQLSEGSTQSCAIESHHTSSSNIVSQAVARATETWHRANVKARIEVAEQFATLLRDHGQACSETQLEGIIAFALRMSQLLSTASGECLKCGKAFKESGSAVSQAYLKSTDGPITTQNMGDRLAATQGMGDMLSMLQLVKDATEQSLTGEGRSYKVWADRAEATRIKVVDGLASLGPRLLSIATTILRKLRIDEPLDSLRALGDSLARLNDAASMLQPLVHYAQWAESGQRAWALRVVGRIGGVVGLQLLCDYIKQHAASKHSENVTAATWGLTELKATPQVTSATRLLLDLLEAVEWETPRWLVMDTLGNVGDSSAIAPLQAICDARRTLSLLRFGDKKYVHPQGTRYRAVQAIKKNKQRM